MRENCRGGETAIRIGLGERDHAQQTQVGTVSAISDRFLTAVSEIESLAAADEHDVLRLLEGWGYYRRARQLHRRKNRCGPTRRSFPTRSADRPRSARASAATTAGAILSIAFDARQTILEANTLRLLQPVAGLRRRSAIDRRTAAALGDGEAVLPGAARAA